MTSGIIRRIDDLGRIVIPKELRQKRGWTEGAPIEIIPDGNDVVLRLYGDNQRLGDLLNELIRQMEERGLDDKEALLEKMMEELKAEGEVNY